MSWIRRRGWLGAIAGSAFAPLAIQALPAQAASTAAVSRHVPAATACAYTQVGFAYINNSSGTHLGSVELLYNSCTRDVYAHGTTYETCKSNGTNCVTADIMKPNSTIVASCESGHGGQPQETCNTAKVNDANTTHFAYAQVGVWAGWTPAF